jgi:peptide/nickel transport system substrate-binding protein
VPRPRDGGRTYVFRLRQGVHFSSGRVVRASDVSASFQRLFAIKHVDFWDVPLYAHLSGVGSCVLGGRCDLSRGISADDRAGTVTFHLDTPDPDFLYELTLPFAFVVPAGTGQALAPQSPPGTGAYRLTSYTAGRLVLTRNPRFEVFAPDAAPDGFPDRIVATLGEPDSAQVASVERGVSDVVSSLTLPGPALARLARLAPSQLHADPLGETEYVFLNTRVPPFDNLAARRAVNEAVDRSHLVALLGGPAAAASTCQVLPPDFPGYRPYCPFGLHRSSAGTWSGPNLARALRLVSASGTRGERVVVWGPKDHGAIAIYFAGLLRQLGYRAVAHLVATPHRYYALVGDPARRAQIGWAGWIKDYTSPADFLKPLFSCSGIAAADPAQTSNYSLLCDPRLDAAMDAAGRLQQQDAVSGQQAWSAIDRAIVDQAAAVPYANDLTLTLLSRRTGDYQFNPEWGVLFDQLWVR